MFQAASSSATFTSHCCTSCLLTLLLKVCTTLELLHRTGIATHSFFDEETDLNITDILRCKFPQVRQCLKWLVFVGAYVYILRQQWQKLGNSPITRPRNNTEYIYNPISWGARWLSGLERWLVQATGLSWPGSNPTTENFTSELWQFRLPRFASVFRRRH